MKRFLILLAFGLAASEKLDRTYLPPPGAKFSGGSPGAIQTPLELPKETTGTLVTENGLPTLGDPQIELGISRGQPEFGQGTTTKAPFAYYTENMPTTTTSYAFTQTTTLPPFQTYGTSASVPINPTTGLPLQYASQNPVNFGYSSIPSSMPSVPSVINRQPGTEGQIANFGQPSYSQGSQLVGQYQDQYPNTEFGSQLPNRQSFQYADGLNLSPQSSEQNQPETNNLNFGLNASRVLPVMVYGQNQYQQGVPPQYLKNKDSKPVSGDLKHYQPGSSSSAEYFNQPSYSSTTPLPSISSTVIPTFGGYVRSERPQADADRNAVIISFENVHTPNGYLYSYDTSNGIHADETGVIDNGTKAKGGYSYIGDDGKIYSVTYTADENGFQPRGDHLPTPPPIPEAIQKVIEQVAREKEDGISDDGSYDEEKYGDKKYQGKLNHYDSPNQYNNNKYIGTPKDNRKKLISRTSNFVENKQNENARPVEFSDSSNVNANTMELAIPPRGSSNRVNNQYETPISDAEGTSPALGYGSPSKGSSIHLPGQKDTKLEYSVSQENYIEPVKYSGTDINKTLEAIANDSQGKSASSGKINNTGKVTGLNNIFGSPQAFGKDNQRLDTAQRPFNNRYTETKDDVPEKSFGLKEAYNGFNDRRPSSKTGLNVGQSEPNEIKPNQNMNSVIDNNDAFNSGYTYNRPQTKFEQNRFPTRFRGQEPSMKLEEYRTTQGTTLKPFMTPNVYNKGDGAQSLFARKPFEVILPTTESTYNDYADDDNDYPKENQGKDTENFSSTKVPVDKTGSTLRPYQFKQSSRPYQYTPVNQGTHFPQRVTPGFKTTEYSVVPTTPMPSESRFKITQSTQNPVSQYKSRSSTGTVYPGSSTNIPKTVVPSRSGFDSHSNGPVTEYSASIIAPDSSPTRNTFGSGIPSAVGISPQNFFTTTYKSASDSGTTVRPGLDHSSSPVAPAFQTSYQYGSSGPPSSSDSNIASYRPVPIPSVPGMYSQVAPGSTYQYGTKDYSQSSPVPVTGTSGSNFQTRISPVSPTVSYQTGYQYGPRLLTTGGSIPPGSFTIDNVRVTPETYSSTTYRPVFNEGYTQRPITVDHFGRPIHSEVISYPEYSSTQNTVPQSYFEGNRGKNPTANQGLTSGNVPASEESTGNTAYPGTTGTTGTTGSIIGEDFSGPKQPQRYDPNTGYHY